MFSFTKTYCQVGKINFECQKLNIQLFILDHFYQPIFKFIGSFFYHFAEAHSGFKILVAVFFTFTVPMWFFSPFSVFVC